MHLPILAKWVLIGRWKPQQIRIWSLAYVRFWIVKTLVRSNPLALFAGSPLYVALPAGAGRESRARVSRSSPGTCRCAPTCSPIGAGTVIRKDSFFLCYRAHAGLIQTGPVTLGKDVFVGEKTVLDIDTSMGDGAQLGHASSLHSGQAVPDGERWHGSPAQRTEVDYRRVAPAYCSTLRRVVFTLVQLLNVLFLYLPLAIAALRMLFAEVPPLARLLDSGSTAFQTWEFYLDCLVVSPCCSSAHPRRPPLRGHRPARAQPVHQAGQGLSAVRLPLLGPPGDRADDQHQVLHVSVR